MTSLERIMCTLTGEPTDCMPFTMLLSLYGASLIKCKTSEYYRSPQMWFEGQEAVVEHFNPDILISPFSFPLEAEAFGSELIFLDKYAPNVRKPMITKLSQTNLLVEPDFDTSDAIQFFLQGISNLSRKYKHTHAIGSPIHAPTDLPALLMGMEMWIDTLLFHPQETDRIMRITSDHFVKMGNEFLNRGATFLVVPVNFTTPMIITEKIFSNLIPYLTEAFSRINGPIVIHNGGAKILGFADRFAKLPNVIAIVLEPTEKFEEARSITNHNIVLMGNFDGPDFVNMSEEKAISKCVKILDNRKHDPHFIFATSNADIPYQTPVQTIKAVVNTIRNYK